MSGEPLGLRTVAEICRAHLEGAFPRSCGNCRRRFDSLAEYLRDTTPIGAPVSFDGNPPVLPAEPIGTLALANCPCGTTLAIGSDGMPRETLLQLMAWARDEVAARGLTLTEVLLELQSEIRAQVLG